MLMLVLTVPAHLLEHIGEHCLREGRRGEHQWGLLEEVVECGYLRGMNHSLPKASKEDVELILYYVLNVHRMYNVLLASNVPVAIGIKSPTDRVRDPGPLK
jgi:hypothetical protein